MTEQHFIDLQRAAKELLDSVTFDDCGAMIAGKFQGGNGGMISRDTIQKADALRRILNRGHQKND